MDRHSQRLENWYLLTDFKSLQRSVLTLVLMPFEVSISLGLDVGYLKLSQDGIRGVFCKEFNWIYLPEYWLR